jgi:hypothetical protein
MMSNETKTGGSLAEKADAAFQQAAIKVVERARQTGTPVIIWEDDHVKEVPPQQLEQRLAASDSSKSQSRQFGLGKGKLRIVSDGDLPEITMQNEENHHATNSTD